MMEKLEAAARQSPLAAMAMSFLAGWLAVKLGRLFCWACDKIADRDPAVAKAENLAAYLEGKAMPAMAYRKMKSRGELRRYKPMADPYFTADRLSRLVHEAEYDRFARAEALAQSERLRKSPGTRNPASRLRIRSAMRRAAASFPDRAGVTAYTEDRYGQLKRERVMKIELEDLHGWYANRLELEKRRPQVPPDELFRRVRDAGYACPACGKTWDDGIAFLPDGEKFLCSDCAADPGQETRDSIRKAMGGRARISETKRREAI